MKKILFAIILSMLLHHVALHSQSETSSRQKFGLTLSGGGAKGLAHIGLLRMVDSLNIHIDYITGTSMGGVFAGLYAMGYSGDSLKTISMNIDWGRILSNAQPYNKIHLREKDEYDSYAFEFTIEKGLPSLPNFLIEGQYLSDILAKYTFNARDINDFHKMVIPLELSTSDIVNGGSIIQRKGYLPLAIRASLSIPAIFSSTIIDNKILVDGGLDRNYPVEEVKKMGADFVIGSYTGYRIQDEKEIRSPLRLINQTFAFNARKDAEKQMEMADITLDFSDALKNYSPSDFKKYKEIIKIGEREARKLLPQLIKIKQLQQKQQITYAHTLLPQKQLNINRINIYEEHGAELSEKEKRVFLNIIADSLHAFDNEKTLKQKTDKILGYNFLNKLYYTYSKDSTQQTHLNFFLKKKPQGTFHAGIHYDTNESAAIILNYTYRNLLFNQSRMILTANISERAKFRLNYYKFLDDRRKYWFMGGFDFRDQKSNDLYLKLISQLYNFTETMFFQSNTKAYLSAGVSISHSTGLEFGIEYNDTRLRKTENIFSNIVATDEPDKKMLYKHRHISVGTRFDQNSLNQKYFATKGNKFQVAAKLIGYNKYRLNKPEIDNKALMAIYTILHPDSAKNRLSDNVIQFSVSNHNVLPISKKWSLHSHFFYGVNLNLHKSVKESMQEDNYLFLSQKFYTGGYANLNDSEYNIFTGLKPGEYPQNNTSSLYLGLQYNPVEKLYITPSMSVGTTLLSLNPFKHENMDEAFYNYGIDIDYMTFLGPLKLSLARIGLIEKNRIFVSFGYTF